jgi:hypothetical protein
MRRYHTANLVSIALDRKCYRRILAISVTQIFLKEMAPMKMVRILVQLPESLKSKLDAERRQGTTASGLTRHLLEQHFTTPATGKKGR